MSNLDFTEQPTVKVLKIIRQKLVEKYNVPMDTGELISLSCHEIDQFLISMTIRGDEFPTTEEKLCELDDTIDAFVLCIGKSLSTMKQVLPTLYTSELIIGVAKEFEFEY
jgi:hypothetical protein